MDQRVSRLKGGVGKFRGLAMSRLSFAIALSAFSLSLSPAYSTTTFYDNEAALMAALGAYVTDDYSSSYPAGFGIYSNAQMSAYFGETDYNTTGFTDWNIVTNGIYCAGCNGSFELLFNDTSFTQNNGVYGFGMNFTNVDTAFLYTAFVTFGDGATQNYVLGHASVFTPGYFGITSDAAIYSVHFALSNVATTNGGFTIDNLTIGSLTGAVPEPGTWAMMLLGFGGIGWNMRRRRPSNDALAVV